MGKELLRDRVIQMINKSSASQRRKKSIVLRKLRSFLDANEPGLVRFLVTMWDKQSKAVTYKEIREAILAGDLDQELLEQWNQEYSLFVTKYLNPLWEKAIAEGASEILSMYPEWNYDPMGDNVQFWTQTKAAEFVTNSTDTQIRGLRAVVQRAAVLEDMTVDQLARAIRPMVGLTVQQSAANLKYYETLVKEGVSEKRALDLSIRYSARQHRYRGYNIARTELAFAYNQGWYGAAKQAQADGYLGKAVKIWCTADDERVCEICGGLDGKVIDLDEDFNFYTKLAGPGNPTIKRVPPAHPSCRCGIMIQEIEPPDWVAQARRLSMQ